MAVLYTDALLVLGDQDDHLLHDVTNIYLFIKFIYLLNLFPYIPFSYIPWKWEKSHLCC
jgi:hypothetical protein